MGGRGEKGNFPLFLPFHLEDTTQGSCYLKQLPLPHRVFAKITRQTVES